MIAPTTTMIVAQLQNPKKVSQKSFSECRTKTVYPPAAQPNLSHKDVQSYAQSHMYDLSS